MSTAEDKSEHELKLQEFTDEVNELIKAKSIFFRKNPQSTDADLEEMISSRGKKILDKYGSLSQTIKGSEKAKYMTLVGRVYNASSQHSKQAEEYLNKAVKMNPTLSEAWNVLGECYYKNKQPEKAQNCFQCVLKHVKDRVALRNLSKIMRSRETISEANIQESIKLSKEALELDMNDGASWFNLGNAYLIAFFYGGQPEKILRQSLFCYEKALLDKTQAEDPDLHYSLAEASRYTENFQTALDRYASAHTCNPTWKDALDNIDNLEMYLKEVDECVRTKGRTRPKKLDQLVKSIKPHHATVFSSPKRMLKDISWDGPKKSEAGHIVLKVVATVSNRALAFTCCAVDENLDAVALSIFNLSEGKSFLVGDTIVIGLLEAKLHSVKLREGVEISFRSLRISDPRTIAVNGRLVTSQSLSPVMLTTELHNS